MTHIEIEGGVPLKGEVGISGSKNAGLLLLAATLLTDEPCEIKGLPDVADIQIMRELVQNTQDWGAESRLRASLVLLGPLLARGKAIVLALPGGCAIGPRPIDLHAKGLRALGAEITVGEYALDAFAPNGLKGARVYLGGPNGSSVLATANVMMAATLAEGWTRIICPACEPEVEQLQLMLARMGVEIVGTPGEMAVRGRTRLCACTLEVIPDRIEAATYLLAGLATGGARPYGDIVLNGADYHHLDALCWELMKMESKYADVHALPYPGFPTDVQPMMAAYLCTHRGGKITDHVFPHRFAYVHQLERMGANISCNGDSIRIIPTKLHGADVEAQDLRGGAALVLAGLAATGTTRVHGVEHIQRGYERLVEKLQGLGARIRLVL